MSKSEIAGHHLVINRVTKYYGEFLAVNQISLCVNENECFGLLGVNGAGKTTTFKMLTGDEKLTFGNAFVKGLSVKTEMNSVYKEIGYCPQFDALLEDLTGREILRIFCLLKGVPIRRIQYTTEELAYSFGFMKHIDKIVRKYSGGNKRKLSAALAVIGNPSVVYFDEPTTGMDPDARRRLWDIVCLVRDSGRAIVLTSHSMEECEALCTRLAIMVNGELMCIGSIQHLKNKFSKGFILKVKVQSAVTKLAKKKKSRRGLRPPKKSSSSLTQAATDGGGNAVVYSIIDDVVNDLTSGSLNSLDSSDSSEYFSFTSSENEAEKFIRKHSLVGIGSNPSLLRLAYAQKVKTYIMEQFPSARLIDYYQGMLTFSIPLTGVKWSEIFGFMERNLRKLNIEDYAITQTTLEEIFLDFAKNQVDVRVHSKKKKCSAFLR